MIIQNDTNVNLAEMELLMNMLGSANSEIRGLAFKILYEQIEDFMWDTLKKEYSDALDDVTRKEDMKAALNLAFIENIRDYDPKAGSLSAYMLVPFKKALKATNERF